MIPSFPGEGEREATMTQIGLEVIAVGKNFQYRPTGSGNIEMFRIFKKGFRRVGRQGGKNKKKNYLKFLIFGHFSFWLGQMEVEPPTGYLPPPSRCRHWNLSDLIGWWFWILYTQCKSFNWNKWLSFIWKHDITNLVTSILFLTENSLNKTKRQREILRVTHENQAILRRILSKEANYNHLQWEHEWRVSYVDFNAKLSLIWGRK